MKLAPNIRVNGLSPGPTLKNKRQSERHSKQWKSVLLKKKVDLEDICKGVKFLIENQSITGEIINIDSDKGLRGRHLI